MQGNGRAGAAETSIMTVAALETPASGAAAAAQAPLRRIRFAPAEPGGFRDVLNARVAAHLKERGATRFADASVYAKGVFYLALGAAAYAALLILQPHGALSLLLAACAGLSALLLALNIGHDAAHRALTGHRGADAIINRLCFALVGVDGYLWQLRHNGSHHIFPNVNGCDIDIDENPLIRLSPNHPRKTWHRWQHLYAPFVYMLTLLHSIFWGDPAYLRKTALANMTGIRHAPRDLAWFAASKAIWLTANIALPLAVLRFAWWEVLLGYAAVTALMSLVFIALLVGTHFSDTSDFPHPGADGMLKTDWAAHQVTTTLDWSPGSRLAIFITGGANAHAAHHLFPHHSHRHYRAITPIIRDTAQAFGLAYHETDFAGLVRAHFRHLKRLGADGPRAAG